MIAKEIVINLGFEDSSINTDEVLVVNEVSETTAANAILPATGQSANTGTGSGGRAANAHRLSQTKSNTRSSGVNKVDTMQLVESSESLDLKK